MADRYERLLWPNVGAEEGDPRRVAKLPPVAATRRLWGGLFDQGTGWLEPGLVAAEPDTCSLHEAPALAMLEETRGLVPWLGTPEAQQAAEAAGLPFAGPAPDIVRRVHDKAFAVRHSLDEGFTPRGIRDVLESHDGPAMAHDPAAFAAGVVEKLRAWPAALRDGDYVLKPRLGTSGRGVRPRPVAGAAAEVIAKAAPRLAERGGAILEPYLRRTTDLSVVLWLFEPGTHADAPPLTIIGGLRQIIDAANVWRGHLGEIDRRGRIYSGTRHDDAMREAAASIAHAARREGFHGPCGLDGFAYRPGQAGRPDDVADSESLRPILEFNARFTMGHVCTGWLRRALPWLVAERGLAPGKRVSFVFALAPPSGAAGWLEATAGTGADVLPLPFPTPLDRAQRALDLGSLDLPNDAPEHRGPALVFHDDPSALAELASAISGPEATAGAAA